MKKRLRIKIIVSIVVLLIIVASFSTALAVTYPGRVYYFSNLGIGGGATVNNELNSMGYTSYLRYDYDAKDIRDYWGTQAVVAYIGHGQPGYLVCDGTGQISAKSVSGMPTNYSFEYKYANTTDKLKKNRLIYFGCCYSDNYSSTYGRLTTYTAGDMAARSTIGFSGQLGDAEATYFEAKLFTYLDDKKTVQTAVNLAKADTQVAFSSTYYTSNVSTAAVYGYGASYVDPAAFGQ